MSCAAFAFRSLLAAGLATATVLLGGEGVARAEARIDDFRVKLEKWVETRQLISQEDSDWQADREVLKASRDLLRQQKKDLQEEVATLDASITEADQERVDLLLDRGEYTRSTGVMAERLAELEAEVRALVPRLPGPLQEKLEPLLVQIPDDPEKSRASLGQRLINVLGVVLQAEKFNSTATLTGETRAVRPGSDQKVQVRTLYWGLGQAVYVDSQGEVAGIGQPGPEGWEFNDDRDLVDEARALLDIYEGNVDVIRFVEIPVQVR